MAELRQALRSLLRARTSTVAILVTIALGVGAATAVYSVVYAVLYKPLPYPEPDRLVAVWQTRARDPKAANPASDAYQAGRAFVSDSLLAAWQREARCFAAIGAYSWDTFSLTANGEAESVSGVVATSSFFKVLGARPLYGRLLHSEDDPPGPGRVVVLGYAFWRQHFGGNPSAVGQTLDVDGVPYTVVGVLPSDFRLAIQYTSSQPAVYTPISRQFTPQQRFAILPGAVARLKTGTSIAAAQAEMTAVMRHLAETSRWYVGRGANVVPLAGEAAETTAGTRRGLMILLAATACVLLIGCVNVSNLLLVRAASRHRELAVHVALGAGRWRVCRQMMLESLLVASVGGLLGLLLAAWGTDALVALIPEALFPRVEEVQLDAHVLAFGIAASLCSGLLAGLAPAWYTLGRDRRGVLTVALKESRGASADGRRSRHVRRALVAAEVILATVLLVGTALLARTYVGLLSIDLGIRTPRVLTFNLMLPPAKYATPESRRVFVDTLLTRLRSSSGIQAAAAAESMPLRSWLSENVAVGVAGRPATDAEPSAALNPVTDGFVETSGITLVAGRTFAPRSATSDAALVSRTFVRRFWPAIASAPASAIGRVITIGKDTHRVIGVVGDVKYEALDSQTTPVVYVPLETSPRDMASILLRTSGDPLAALPAVRAMVQAIDPAMALHAPRTLDQVLDETVAAPRFRLATVGLFAGLALLLACIGVYGVVAQSVAQRSHEIGVRLALGAGRPRIVRMVLMEGVTMTAVGVAVGVAVSVAAGRVLATFLFGVAPTDVAAYGSAAATMLVVAAIAGILPASRASAINPVDALRDE